LRPLPYIGLLAPLMSRLRAGFWSVRLRALTPQLIEQY